MGFIWSGCIPPPPTMKSFREICYELAESGIVISFAYGPSAGIGRLWSVQAMNRDGEEFAKPFGALSIEHAGEIALRECTKRGWIVAKV